MPIRLPKAKSTNKFVYEKDTTGLIFTGCRPFDGSRGGSDREPFTPGQPETPEQPGGDDNGEPDTPAPGGNGRYLVLYASRTNNTGRVAQLIQTTLGCDLLEVEPETPYDNDYNAMLERSQEELAAIRQGDYPPSRLLLKISMTMI